MPEFRVKRLYYTTVERAISRYYDLGSVYSSNLSPMVLPNGETEDFLDVTICGENKIFKGGLHIYKSDEEWVISTSNESISNN